MQCVEQILYFFFIHFITPFLLVIIIIRARFRCRLFGSLTAKRALNDDNFSLTNFHVFPLIRELRGNLVLFLVYVYFDARIVTVCSLQVNDRLDEIIPLSEIPKRMLAMDDVHSPLTTFNYNNFYYL